MKNTDQKSLTSITKEWTVRRKLIFKDRIKVSAEQVEMPPKFGGIAVTAKVKIYKNGVIIHEAEVPWPMPKDDIMLAMQVYLLAKKPDYSKPEYQPYMEKFALMCKGFEPPDRLWWSNEPFGL